MPFVFFWISLSIDQRRIYRFWHIWHRFLQQRQLVENMTVQLLKVLKPLIRLLVWRSKSLLLFYHDVSWQDIPSQPNLGVILYHSGPVGHAKKSNFLPPQNQLPAMVRSIIIVSPHLCPTTGYQIIHKHFLSPYICKFITTKCKQVTSKSHRPSSPWLTQWYSRRYRWDKAQQKICQQKRVRRVRKKQNIPWN